MKEACVIGSIYYNDYQTEGSIGNVRGKAAINSLINILEKGCKVAIIIAKETDPKFVDDLKEKLSILGNKSENIVWNFERESGYSEARREAISLARSKYTEPPPRVFIMQEIEKNLSENYEDFLNTLSKDRVLVMMDRGINISNNQDLWPEPDHSDVNLPKDQLWGERSQNIKMARQEEVFGLTDKTKGNHLWDRLNGVRIIRNELMKTGNVEINPSDLILLKYEYSDGYTEEDRRFKMDGYSASVYNPIPILEALGAENQMAQVSVNYLHPEEQRQQEENDPNFREKRLRQKTDLPANNFEIVANIKKWQKEGRWPQVLLEALKGDKVLHIVHLKEDEYFYGYSN